MLLFALGIWRGREGEGEREKGEIFKPKLYEKIWIIRWAKIKVLNNKKFEYFCFSQQQQNK